MVDERHEDGPKLQELLHKLEEQSQHLSEMKATIHEIDKYLRLCLKLIVVMFVIVVYVIINSKS